MPTPTASDVRQSAKKAYGAVPNVIEAMIEHTSVPGAVYVAADETLVNGLLTPAEQQAVLLVLSEHYDSRYDGVVHARMALDAGLSPVTIDTLFAGQLPQDDRLRALVEATRQTYNERGWLDPDTVQNLEERGISRGELYEIFALHGMKTFSSFVNHIADTDVDGPLKPTEEQFDNVPEEPSTIEMRRLVLG